MKCFRLLLQAVWTYLLPTSGLFRICTSWRALPRKYPKEFRGGIANWRTYILVCVMYLSGIDLSLSHAANEIALNRNRTSYPYAIPNAMDLKQKDARAGARQNRSGVLPSPSSCLSRSAWVHGEARIAVPMRWGVHLAARGGRLRAEGLFTNNRAAIFLGLEWEENGQAHPAPPVASPSTPRTPSRSALPRTSARTNPSERRGSRWQRAIPPKINKPPPFHFEATTRPTIMLSMAAKSKLAENQK